MASVPIVDQLPAPAGETSKTACWTPEPPVSAESEATTTAFPWTNCAVGAVIDPVGAVPSNVNVVAEKSSTFPAVSIARA